MITRHLKVLVFSPALALVLGLSQKALALTAIPSQAWQRDINASGYTDGAPIGGLGAGSITWKNNGNFYLDRLNLAASTITEDANDHFYFYQKPSGGSASSLKLNAATLGSGQATYYALFPKSWVDYNGSQFTCKVRVRQFSPVIPNDLTRTSYPLAVYQWEITNPTAASCDVAVMLTWNNNFGGNNAVTLSGNTGLTLQHTGGTTTQAQGEFTLASQAQAGVTISVASNATLANLETAFAAAGTLPNTVGANGLGGIAVKATLAPGQTITIPLVLAWDIPLFKTGTGPMWYREYTRWFNRNGQNSAALAQQALSNAAAWEASVDGWQGGILSNPAYPDWLKTDMFNELYYLFTGGTVWEAGAASGQTDNPNEDMFSLLETYIYAFYGTSDVRFYSSWALFQLWPDIDKQEIRQFCDSVTTTRTDRPAPLGTCAHDFGDPNTLFSAWNAYTYRDSTTWKDLNSKLVLTIYRDWALPGKNDPAFLNYCWPAVKVAMAKVHSQCDAGGLPVSSGVDQTYDDMGLTGETSYCGGLFLAACQAAQKLAADMGDTASAATYQTWFNTGQPTFEANLWTGTYYQIDTASAAPTRIMSDQLCGHWYSKALGLGGIVTSAHAQSAYSKIYNNNFMGFNGGTDGVCNVMTAGGAIDTTSVQTEETWVGTSWGLTSGMILEGMTTQANAIGASIYNSIWNTGQLWFRTPEAWQSAISNVRAPYYMRANTVWAVKEAYDSINNCGANTCTPTLTLSPTPTFTATPTPNPCATSILRINCAGPAYTDHLGRVWSADKAFAAGSWGHMSGTAAVAITAAISGTQDQTTYQTEEYGNPVWYRITEPNGSYTVTLKFVEQYWNAAGSRVFSVYLNGNLVIPNLDIYATVGKDAAYDRSFPVTVTNGFIDVYEVASSDNAEITGIEVVDNNTPCTPTPTITPGGATATNTRTATPNISPTPSQVVSPTPTASLSSSFTTTPSRSPSATPSLSLTLSPSFTPSSTFSLTLSPSPTFTPNPCAPAWRLRCGGAAAYTDTGGRIWQADQAYTAGGYGYISGSTGSSTNAIAGTADQALYQTERYGNPFEYRFDLPNGLYHVTLKFADFYFTTPGSRVFSVAINGATVISNLDLVAVAGANTAYDRGFWIQVSAGSLDLMGTASADNAMIDSIEVVQSGAPGCSPTATPTDSTTASPTAMPSLTDSTTATPTTMPSLTATPSASPRPTPSFSVSPTFTKSPLASATVSPTLSPTPLPSASPTQSASASPSPLPSPSPTPSGSPSLTASPSPSPTVTPEASPSNSGTPTQTTSFSVTATPTLSGTITSSFTPVPTNSTATDSPTASPTAMPSLTGSTTASPTAMPSLTATPSASPPSTFTPSPTATPSFSATPSASLTPTPMASTATPSPSPALGSGGQPRQAVTAPNPGDGRQGLLVFQMDAPTDGVEVAIYSEAMRLLWKADLSPAGGFPGGWNHVPLPDLSLASGTYFARVEAGGHAAIARWVVLR